MIEAMMRSFTIIASDPHRSFSLDALNHASNYRFELTDRLMGTSWGRPRSGIVKRFMRGR